MVCMWFVCGNFDVIPYLYKIDLADLSSFKQNLDIFAANIEISFNFRIREFKLEQTKFPVF